MVLSIRLSFSFGLLLAGTAAFAACTKDEPAAEGDDAGVIDGAEAGAPDVDAPEVDAGPPKRDHLSQTGLYADIGSKKLAADVIEFEPAYKLWSDGATKRRWIRLPKGSKIDTSDMNYWKFPVGTQVWKEFSRDGKRIETRLIEHVADTGKDEVDYWRGAFIWNDGETDADFAVDGKQNARGTTHDVPSQEACWTCHYAEPGHVLGFAAVQLSREGPASLKWLTEQKLLSHPPPAGVDYPVPGDAVSAKALGYLHANCGHCHNPNGLAWSDATMMLRILVNEKTAEDTQIYKTTVSTRLQSWSHPPFAYRIVPEDAGSSAVVHRMTSRGNLDQMPPLATEINDDAGVADVLSWINSL